MMKVSGLSLECIARRGRRQRDIRGTGQELSVIMGTVDYPPTIVVEQIMRYSPLRHAVGFILLFALTTLAVSAQTAKDKTKDKAGDKNKAAPAKTEEPKAVVALRALGANLHAEGKAVTGVSFFGTKVTDADLAQLAGFKELESLDLAGTAVTDAGLAAIKGLTSLKTLDLRGTKITDAGLASLQGLTALEFLNLNDTNTGGNITPLGKLVKLKTLSLAQTIVNDSSLGPIGSLSALRTFSLYGTGIGDGALAALKGLTNLQTLDLGSTKITDAGLAQLKPLVGLRKLVLTSTAVTDAGMKHLAALTGLTRLELGGTNVKATGLEELRRSLPKDAKINR
jgi:Leucine-rich repeat (LRR) protein